MWAFFTALFITAQSIVLPLAPQRHNSLTPSHFPRLRSSRVQTSRIPLKITNLSSRPSSTEIKDLIVDITGRWMQVVKITQYTIPNMVNEYLAFVETHGLTNLDDDEYMVAKGMLQNIIDAQEKQLDAASSYRTAVFAVYRHISKNGQVSEDDEMRMKKMMEEIAGETLQVMEVLKKLVPMRRQV